METLFDWSAILSAVGTLMILTNIIVQVLKKVTYDTVPTNALVVVVSMILTLSSFFALCDIRCIAVTWYSVAGAVVTGLLVAYAAMFGYDKLREGIMQFNRMH